ncbi:hypothetical protein [Formosa algae]|uniref:hypothetical protein n=1 Tax=Formosa algae TaxID=225843 RepID=UPI000CCFB378|nr:hypothetical protein [Formosa algae]PNW28704.1 hypothetical protein BKP44_07235 [Formosa algae]
MKKYISNDNSQILFHDLLISEYKSIEIQLKELIDYKIYPSKENLEPILNKIFTIIDRLIHLIANATFWAKPIHYKTIIEILTRISILPEIKGQFNSDTRNFFLFPSTIILYTIGIISVKTEKYDLLKSCFNIKIKDIYDGGERKYIIKNVNSNFFDKAILNEILNKNYKTPISTFLYEKLRPMTEEIIYDNDEYQDLIDVFEYLLSLNYINLVGEEFGRTWAPYGQFTWRRSSYKSEYSNLLEDLIQKANEKQDSWKLLKSGMFNGKIADFKLAQNKLAEFLKDIHF